MMYWPKPHELQYRLSEQAARSGCEVITANILDVDRCWRGSIEDEYIPHTKTYHYEEIDQGARDDLLANSDQLIIPEVRMLGNSHLAITEGVHLFVLLREMADLGYLQRMPFAVSPWDAPKFQFYFQGRQPESWDNVSLGKCPLATRPMLQLQGES